VKCIPEDKWFDKGSELLAQNSFLKAIKMFEKSVKKYPHNELAWYKLGIAFAGWDKLSNSIRCFEKVLTINPDCELALLQKAYSVQRLGNLEEANELYDKYISRSQDDMRIITAIKRKIANNNRLKKRGIKIVPQKYEKALKITENLLVRDKKNYEVLMLQGEIYSEMRDYQKAIKTYEQAKLIKETEAVRSAIKRIKDKIDDRQRKSKPKSIPPKIDEKLAVPPGADTTTERNKERELPPLFGISMAIFTSKKINLRKGEDVKSLISALNYFGVKEYITLQIDFMSMYYGITNQIKINDVLNEIIELAAKFMGFTRNDPEAFDLFNSALEYITKTKIAKGLGLIEKAIELCPNNPIYAAELYKTHQQVGNIKKARDIRKNFEDKISQFQSKEFQQKEFEKINKSVESEISHCNDFKKNYITIVKSEKGILDFLNVTIYEIAKYLEGDSKTVNKNNLSKIIDDCLICLELISHVASLSFFKLKMNLGNAQFDNKIKTSIIDILGWEPEPLPPVQTPNFLSPSLRKENWFTTLGMDVLSFRMMNSIQEARYRHIDGNEKNDDSKTHMWQSKEVADQVNIAKQNKLHDRLERDMIAQHIEDHFGEDFKVLHSKKSFSVHIDIYVVPPTKERRYGLLITSGMSELPMNPPPDVWKWWKIDVNKLPKEARKALNCDYAELVIKLPPDWPLPSEELKKDDYFWPIEELHHLINYVHNDKQWFWDGHTFGGESGSTTFAKNTKLAGWLFVFPSLFLPQKFPMLKISPSKLICFLQLIPLYSEEIKFALRNGKPALLKKLDEFKIKDHIDINRLNVCKIKETNN